MKYNLISLSELERIAPTVTYSSRICEVRFSPIRGVSFLVTEYDGKWMILDSVASRDPYPFGIEYWVHHIKEKHMKRLKAVRCKMSELELEEKLLTTLWPCD